MDLGKHHVSQKFGISNSSMLMNIGSWGGVRWRIFFAKAWASQSLRQKEIRRREEDVEVSRIHGYHIQSGDMASFNYSVCVIW